MDYQSIIKAPIASELDDFIGLFNRAMTHQDGLLQQALDHIRQRAGKRMRPMLILLMAKSEGKVTDATLHAAVGLELLHTASLVHDDVVDESPERRGQESVNNLYDNKVAVLVGDYILSTALLHVNYTHNETIVRYLAELGRTLSNGEILQLSNTQADDFSEEVYYQVIQQKTAALFEACAAIGVLSAGASEEDIEDAKTFGRNLGVIFQIRDDIFDYYDQSAIGKPTGNDMAEGKLTLPALYALNTTQDADMLAIARRVRHGGVGHEDIARLVAFTKAHGGIEYAEQKMQDLHAQSSVLLDSKTMPDDVRAALHAYLDYVIDRDK